MIVLLLYPIGRRLLGTPAALLGLWLAATSPFGIWYSQEVRMYTLGAALGLLCLFALLRFLDGRRRYWWLGVYALAAAAGLYVLYYFAFLILALNLIAVGAIGYSAALQGRRRDGLTWLAGQAGAFFLWLPWLPIFWRQATDPPVPPWRVPWTSLTNCSPAWPRQAAR